MVFRIKEITNPREKVAIAGDILNDLPEWFGLEDSKKEYIRASKDKAFLACLVRDEPAGFIVLNETGKTCAEIFVMGVKKKYHHMGIGTALNRAYEALAKELGYNYSQVKTVQTGHYKEYDLTNQFYLAMGYEELECFPDLWDPWNPCQIYIKYLGGTKMFDEKDPTHNVQAFSQELSEEELREVQGVEKKNDKQTSTVVSTFVFTNEEEDTRQEKDD